MNLTDKRVLFTADRAAQLIHSADTVDALIVMKAQSQNARDVAITWVNKGHTLDPWPLANPDARGEMLVDHRTADLCQQIHEEALLVQGLNPLPAPTTCKRVPKARTKPLKTAKSASHASAAAVTVMAATGVNVVNALSAATCRLKDRHSSRMLKFQSKICLKPSRRQR